MNDTTTNQQNQTIHGLQVNAAGDVNIGHSGDNINTGGGDYVARDKVVIHQAPKEPITFPHYYIALPKNSYFTGRVAELAGIHTAVGDGGVGVIIQVIAGLGGVGKTQLAAQYAHLHFVDYDLIYWLPAENELALMEAMAILAYRFQLAKLEDAQPQIAAQAAIAWLENSQQRWLLIYDNADLPAMTRRTLQKYLPKTGNGATLISSRNSDWGDWKPLQLKDFSDDEAVGFMERRLGAGAVADRESATALAQELGGLALALEHAVAYVERHTKTIADYLRLFRQRREALWAKATPPADYREKTITTTWILSFEALAVDAPDAAALLNLCAFFAPDGIPTVLLSAHADRLPPPLDTCAADELRLDEAIAAAKSHSLLSVTDDGLHMHRLVQLVAQARMEDKERWLNAVVTLLGRAWLFDRHNMTTWDACPLLLPHLIATVDYADQYDLRASNVAYLNTMVAHYLKFFGDNKKAFSFYKRDLSIQEGMFADNPDNEVLLTAIAGSLNNLGSLLVAMGNLEGAFPLYKRTLSIAEEHLGSSHPNTATCLNNLGLLLQAMQKYEEALPLVERSLVIREKQFGSDHPHTADILNNLGSLLKAMGDYENALPLMIHALSTREKQLGSDHPDTAQSLNNLGSLWQVMGEYKEARPLFECALAITENQFGSKHSSTATRINNLALLAYDEGDNREAARLMRQALAILEETLGDAHPHTKTARQSLAIIEAA